MHCNKKKTQGFQRMVLFIKLFAYIKRFGFWTFARLHELSNEMKQMRKFKNILFPLVAFVFQICMM